MAIGANSYGAIAEIAALTPRRTRDGSFDISTRPTLLQVESIVDQVSGVVNAILAQNGFSIPVSQADAKLMLDFFVNEEVAAIVEGINNAGRFGPTSKKPGAAGRFAVILEDVQAFIESSAAGLERLGATRSFVLASGIGYRDTDETSDEVHPIFQREGFGNSFANWDDN